MEDVAVARRLFTVEEYCALWDAGILGEEDRVELIASNVSASWATESRPCWVTRSAMA